MGELRFETKLKGMEVYRDPQERKGHVDVRTFLTRGRNEEGLEEMEAVMDVRVYFTTEDVPVQKLIDSAFRRARRAVARALELWPADQDEDPESLWFE